MIDWIEFFGNQPGFDQQSLGDVSAVEIPIYEAILASQLLTSDRNTQAYIETEQGSVINFPNPVPGVLVQDIRTDFRRGRNRGPAKQLNPLLSPSMRLMKREFPELFKNSRKYITEKRFDSEEMGGVKIEDRVGLILPKDTDEVNENLTTYLASMYLRRKGYIVDPFSGGLPGRGDPDLYAVKIPDLQRKLYDADVTAGGFYLNELELPEIPKFNSTVPTEARTVVLEIESAYDDQRFYDAKDEATEYAEDGWYDAGIGVMGFVNDRLQNWEERLDVGFITFDQYGNFTQIPCSEDYGTERTEEVTEIVRRVIKLALLKNESLPRVLEFLDANSFYDIATNVDDQSVSEVLDFVGIGGD